MRVRIAVLVLLLILLALGLGLAFQQMVRNTVAVPVAYFVWLVGLVFRSVPGFLWWAWLLIIALIIVSKSLRTRAKPDDWQPRSVQSGEGLVTSWAHRLRLAGESAFFRWRLAYDLARLGLALAAYREGITTASRDPAHVAEVLNAPPEIRAYLSAGMGGPPQETSHLPDTLTEIPGWTAAQIKALATRLFRPAERKSRQRGPSPLAIPPERIIAFLEEELR